MTEYTPSWIRTCSTSDLNVMLSNSKASRMLYPQGTIENVQAEKDRRLADPNSPDFRPTFF